MSKITTYKDESLVDVAIRSYGHIEGLPDLARDNGLAIDAVETDAVERDVNDERVLELKQVRPLFPPAVVIKVQDTVVDSDQNIIDLALQETGDIAGLVALLKENGIGLEDEPVTGAVINVNTNDIANLDVVQYYRALRHKVNTGGEIGEFVLMEGDEGFIVLEGGSGFILLEN